MKHDFSQWPKTLYHTKVYEIKYLHTYGSSYVCSGVYEFDEDEFMIFNFINRGRPRLRGFHDNLAIRKIYLVTKI